jgi:cobaltochelatase CobT
MGWFKSFWAGLMPRARQLEPVCDGPPEEPYAIYTEQYDLEISAVGLEMALSSASMDKQNGWFEVDDFQWREAEKSASAIFDDQHAPRQNFLAELRALEETEELSNTAMVILVDQSGSMKGSVIEQLAATMRSLTECLVSAGVKVELLGYSTAGWHGGFARRDWIAAGRPPRPGRLCSLLHIVYKSADEPLLNMQSWRAMLNPNILRENVDGEALLWGWQRLKERQEHRKILLTVSDGAPVDDSTLTDNGPSYLWRHMTSVINDLENDANIELAAIGVGYEFDALYKHSVNADSLDDLFPISASFLRSVLARANGIKGSAD